MSTLNFSIGPVQSFVAQSRRTRDLWASSYLLSWLTGKAILGAFDAVGDAQLVSPALERAKVAELLTRDHAAMPNVFEMETSEPMLAAHAATAAANEAW